MTDIAAIARAMVAPGKGLLAADESVATANKRLAAVGIEETEEMRRQYRDLFLAAPRMDEYLSGVILYEETLGQSATDGTPFPELLLGKGVLPGVKVDEGTEPLPGSTKEVITKGLIGLPERLQHHVETHGTAFTKWRAVLRIEGDKLPSDACIVENAKRLASYARTAQEAGMVPIVEPEVLLEGSHSRVRARAVIESTLSALMHALEDHAVDVSALILKTSMALSGSEARKDTPEEVAEDTLAALMKVMPRQLAGVVFLSGGQTPSQATDNLRAIARQAKEKGAPWPLTFSYARALQEEALEIWRGEEKNVPAAREAFLARLQAVSKASLGH